MARIEYMRLRLNNWALWKARESAGGLGFASQSSFLNDFDNDRYREARIPVDDVDAALTNQAVEALLPARENLYATLQCMYPQAMTARETARKCGVAESTIKARLEQADLALTLWLRDRREANAKRSSATETFSVHFRHSV